MITRSVFAAAVLIGLAGCGYRVVGPDVGAGRSLAVVTAANDTRWRGIEAGFTGALRSDAQRLLDVRLTGKPADLVLETEVHDVVREAPVRDRAGAALAGAVELEVAWTLLDGEGKEIGTGRVRRTLEFLPSEDESAESVIAEILDSIAEYVVIEVGTRLAGEAHSS